MLDTSRKIKFNKALGKPAALLHVIPVAMAKSWGTIIGITACVYFGLQSCGFTPDPLLFIGFAGSAIVTDWILIGKEPWHFLGKLRKAKVRARAGISFAPTEQTLKPKLAPQKIGKRYVHPIENRIHLASYISYRLQGQRVGAYLLQDGRKFRVVFAFECKGYVSTIDAQRGKAIAVQIQEGLKDLPLGELLTFVISSHANDDERQAELKALEQKAADQELKFLIRWLQKRTETLTDPRVNKHNPKRLIIYMTYTVGAGQEKPDDPMESILHELQTLAHRAQGQSNVSIKLKPLLLDAFNRGYHSIHSFLNQKLKLPVTPLNETQLWAIDYKRFNKGAVPKLPYLLVVDKKGLHLKRNGSAHIASLMFAQGSPQEDKRFMYLPGRKVFVGGAIWGDKPNREWDAHDPAERLAQLLFGSSAINDPSVVNCDLTVQFTGCDQRSVLQNAQDLTSEGNLGARTATDKGKLDLGAEWNKHTAVDSEWLLRSGAVAVRMGWAASIERPSVPELDLALQNFTSLSTFTGGVVSHEKEYWHEIWPQTLPFTWSTLLYRPWDRRMQDTTHALTSFVPLIYDQTRDRQGVEFISHCGYTPIYFNPFGKSPHNHAIILGATGAGKSLMEMASIIYALAVGANVVIVDATRGDGSGTFDPLTSFVGGAYFNTTKDSFNLFQGSDFRKIKDPEAYELAWNLFKDFLVTGLKDLALGDDPDKAKARIYKQVLSILIGRFLKEPEIRDRYDIAYDGGFGSAAWQVIPTLKDFAKYLKVDNLPEEAVTPASEQAVREINLSISAILSRPIGESISRPSTFRTESKLVVVALGNLTNNEDAMPLALAAQSFVISSSLDNDETLFIGDETSYLSGFESYSRMLGSFFSGGRKLGIWCHLLGQTLKPIIESVSGADILENTNTFKIGFVAKEALPGLIKQGIPENLLLQNILDEFLPPRQEAASSWLISSKGNHIHANFYPSFAHLALAMNSKPELRLRNEYLARYPENKYRAISKLAHHLRSQTLDALHTGH